MADRIAIIDEGYTKEPGTHHELLAAGNTYAKLLDYSRRGIAKL